MFHDLSSVCRMLLVGAHFFLVLFLIWKCRRLISDALGEIPRPWYVFLAVLVCIQVFIYVHVITPKHVVYTDEFLYQEAAKNVLSLGHFGHLPKSDGWAFLIALCYVFTGVKNYVSIYLSEVLGIAGSVCFFFLAAWVSGSRFTAALSTVIFAFIPARLFWAATGESHIASLCMVVLAAAFSFLFYRKSERLLFWLAIVTWAFASQVRGENIFLLGLFFIGVRLFVPVSSRQGLPYFNGIGIALLLTMPHLLLGIKGVVAYSTWATGGVNERGLNVQSLLHNIVQFGPRFLSSSLHPWALSFMTAVGAVILGFKDRRTLFFCLAWLLLVGLIYFSMWFSIYGGSHELFSKTQLFVFFYPAFVILSAIGIAWLSGVLAGRYRDFAGAAICAAIIWQTVPYYGHYPLRSDPLELEMKVIDHVAQGISAEEGVVTCEPVVLTTAVGLNVTGAKAFLTDPVARKVLFTTSRRVLFVETRGIFNEPCLSLWATIRKEGRAVPVWSMAQGLTRYSIYSLKPF
jgi:hypothetical protein